MLTPLLAWEVLLLIIYCVSFDVESKVRQPINDLYGVNYIASTNNRARTYANQLVFADAGKKHLCNAFQYYIVINP